MGRMKNAKRCLNARLFARKATIFFIWSPKGAKIERDQTHLSSYCSYSPFSSSTKRRYTQDSPQDKQLTMLTPPEQFGIVEPGLYRSDTLHPSHFPFIRSLNIKTAILLTPELPSRAMSNFFEENQIRLIDLALGSWKNNSNNNNNNNNSGGGEGGNSSSNNANTTTTATTTTSTTIILSTEKPISRPWPLLRSQLHLFKPVGGNL
jgi:hypothetical protein